MLVDCCDVRGWRGQWEAMSRNDEGCSAPRSWCHTLLAKGKERVHQLQLQLRLQFRLQFEHDGTTSNSPCELRVVNVIRCCKLPPSSGSDVTTVAVRRCNVAGSAYTCMARCQWLRLPAASLFSQNFVSQIRPFTKIYKSWTENSCSVYVAVCFIGDLYV